MAETKITKEMKYNAIMNMVKDANAVEIDGVKITADMIIEFAKTSITQLQSRADRARTKAAEKKAEGDDLQAKILELITENWQTADAITITLGDENISKNKVVARLGKLVTNGDIVKENRKDGDSKKMHYRLAGVVDATDEE